VAQRLAREEPDDAMADDPPPELFAQLQAEAATTWRSPATAERVCGNEGLRAGCDGFSLHAGIVVPTTIATRSSACAATAPPCVRPGPAGVDQRRQDLVPTQAAWPDAAPPGARARRIPAPIGRHHPTASTPSGSLRGRVRPGRQGAQQAPRADPRNKHRRRGHMPDIRHADPGARPPCCSCPTCCAACSPRTS
jgi:hypothetical protein